MEILAHRGYWISPEEKNSKTAFIRSSQQGFGIETDIRDYEGKLVIAHNVPTPGEPLMLFDDFLQLYLRYATPRYLAINIKSDGLQELLLQALKRSQIEKYFVFDMSVPDTLAYRQKGIRFFSRVSEYEEQPVMFEHCDGIWVDAFHSIWYRTRDLYCYLEKRKKICIVSPELHQREYLNLWENLKKDGLHLYDSVLLCTDFPDRAINYFNE